MKKNNKKLKILIAVFITVNLFTQSCSEEFLDIDANQITANSITEEQAVELVNGIYNIFISWQVSSFSWNGSAFTPDNWVIMGPIDLTNVSDALLEWEVQGIDPAYCNENYSIYVGPSNDYNDLINNSYVSYNETLESGGDSCGAWADRSLDISAATGNLVYIGMRHHDVTDVYLLSIDNVSVTSNTMSNEDFTLQNIDYSFDQETNLLRVTSEEMLTNIQIYNMLGQEVLSQDLNETSALLNLSSLSSSIYIVNIEGNNSKTKTFKLAIK